MQTLRLKTNKAEAQPSLVIMQPNLECQCACKKLELPLFCITTTISRWVMLRYAWLQQQNVAWPWIKHLCTIPTTTPCHLYNDRPHHGLCSVAPRAFL